MSFEYEMNQNADFKKQESRKLLGRSDFFEKHKETGFNLVRDDFGVYILYDVAFVDVRSLETEMLKIASYFINKLEPIIDNDLNNVYPAVDRLAMVEEILEHE